MPKRSTSFIGGWILSTLLGVFLAFVALMEIMNTPEVQAGFDQMGFKGPVSALGVVLLLSVAIYLYKRTAVLGAILLTAYFGGAVCVHFILGQTSLTAVPFLFGVAVWAGLFLREKQLRSLLPLVK